jgi:hypothetical protein
MYVADIIAAAVCRLMCVQRHRRAWLCKFRVRWQPAWGQAAEIAGIRGPDSHQQQHLKPLRRAEPARLVREPLQEHGLRATHHARRRDQHLGLAVQHARREARTREAAEHDRVHGANARAREHREWQLEDHRHVDRDEVAGPHAPRAQPVADAADLRQRGAIRHRAAIRCARQRAVRRARRCVLLQAVRGLRATSAAARRRSRHHRDKLRLAASVATSYSMGVAQGSLPSHMKASSLPRPSWTLRSRQLYAMLVLPPLNHETWMGPLRTSMLHAMCLSSHCNPREHLLSCAELLLILFPGMLEASGNSVHQARQQPVSTTVVAVAPACGGAADTYRRAGGSWRVQTSMCQLTTPDCQHARCANGAGGPGSPRTF